MVWVIGVGIFLVLLFAFPRQMGYLFLGLLGIAAALYFANQLEQAQKSKVSVRAAFDKAVCANPEFPIAVWISNGASKTVTHTSFRLAGYRPSHSSAVASQFAQTDRIIEPGGIYSACWQPPSTFNSPPLDLSSLNWEAEVTSVQFKSNR